MSSTKQIGLPCTKFVSEGDKINRAPPNHNLREILRFSCSDNLEDI